MTEEIKAQVFLSSFDSEAMSVLRELPPGNEEPSYAKIQTGKMDFFSPIGVSGADNQCVTERNSNGGCVGGS